MITVHRASERLQGQPKEAWLTFHPHDEGEDLEKGSGPLHTFKEGTLPPRGAAQVPVDDVEIITYVHEGTLLYEDSAGHTGVLRAGEFQRTTALRGMRRSESNASNKEWAHVFQICLRPTGSDSDLEAGDEQRRFSNAQRHGGLRVVATPDGRKGSLLLHQDASVYSGIFDGGQRVVHELAGGRSAWLYVVAGNIQLGDEQLGLGDAAGFRHERAVSVTTTDDTELLLVDLVMAGDSNGSSPSHRAGTA